MVLAAGAGRRFGGAKMLALFRGRPLVCWAVQSALDTGADRVIVVVPVSDLALEAALASAFASALDTGRLVLSAAPDACEGMGASLRHGVRACGPADAIFVFLGDMPLIPADVAPTLVKAIRAGAAAAAPVWQGRRGHPVLFAAELRPRLLEAKGDTGMQNLLVELGPRFKTFEASGDSILFDIDKVEDFADRYYDLDGETTPS